MLNSTRQRNLFLYLFNNSGETAQQERRAHGARPQGMSHANLLRVAKGGACPPLWNSYLFLLVVFLVLVSMVAQAHRYHYGHNYVYPTNYGYGVMERHSGVVRPYISPVGMPYSPYYYYNYNGYNYNGYYYNGLYSSYGYGSAQGRGTPAWVTTDYLNVRSEPEIYRRDRHANVIGSLRYGEWVWVYGVTGDWYYIRSASNPNVYGYAHRGYLALPGNQQSSYYVPPTYYLR